MIIYRVQNEEGNGPYSGSSNLKKENPQLYKMAIKHQNAKEHPAWGVELHPFDYFHLRMLPWGTYRSGFKTLKQLKTWFEGYIDELKKAGFKIVKYKVPKAETVFVASGKQVIYRVDKAVLVN